MARKKHASEPSPFSQLRGVETFDTNEVVILVRGEVEAVAEALARQRKADLWQKKVKGQSVTITKGSFIVLRMRGHTWTLITPCTIDRKSAIKAADAKALSRELRTRAIYFANSDTASFTEYELFNEGRSLEHFRCYEGVEFTSAARRVDAPEDGPGIYDFVSEFIREQEAFVPALSIHLNAGWMKAGEETELEPEDELPNAAFERVDFVAVGD